MRTILLVVLTAMAFQCEAQYNPYEEWMREGVYRIGLKVSKDSTCFGTAFIVSYKGEKYAVSARHIFGTPDQQSKIDFEGIYWTLTLSNDSIVQDFNRKAYFLKNSTVDIVVFPLDTTYLPSIRIECQRYSRGTKMGAISIFVGYPTIKNNKGVIEPICTSKDNVACSPLVKVGRVSGYNLVNENSDQILVDAMNFKGFSGAPLYTYDEPTGNYVLSGVVSGYINQPTSVPSNSGMLENTTVQSNGGLTKCSWSDNIFVLIDSINDARIVNADN